MDLSSPQLIHALSTISSDRTDRTVTLDDVDLELRYAPEPGVDVRIRGSDADKPDRAVVVTNFGAAADRPLRYPPELPYLPGVKVSVMAPADRPHAWAMWMLDDVESALAGILAQSEADGWIRADKADDGAFPPGTRTIVLARRGRCRTIMATALGASSAVTLIDGAEGE